MNHYEVRIRADADLSNSEQLIEGCCQAEGLHQNLKGTLSKHPGCVHYHYKKDKQRGTLEITLYRLYFSSEQCAARSF